MKRVKKLTWMALVALAMGIPVSRAADVELLQSTIVDNNALNFSSSAASFNRNINGRTYQRFPMATFKGYQYATYYDDDRYVCLARRKLPVGAWEIIRFTNYTINSHDSHNITSIGICEKDGTIHLMFDHHKHDLNYRVSEIGAASNPDSVTWSTDLFSPITDQLGSVGKITQLTYPSFFNAPNGNLMLYYRYGGSGSGDGMIQEYNGMTHDWASGLGKFISRSGTYNGAVSSNSTSRNPYINGISFGGNRLHASWGWRESSGGAQYNHDLNYAYSDDHGRTWFNNAGTQIGTTGSSFISINSPGLIVAPIPQDIGLSNQYTHYAFPDGSCHVIVAHENASNSQRSQHYWRNAAGVWSGDDLPFHAGRAKVTGDDDGNLFLVYESSDRPRIAKGVPNSGQTAWNWSLVYTQSDTTEGGEGQIDYSRWEADRVLSFFGQETPSNSGETPSALHVIDYKVSTKATQPNPAHGASVDDLNAGLAWSAGVDAIVHQIYFGTNKQSVATANTSSPEYQGQQTGTVFTPSPVPSDPNTYYWRIDEVQADFSVIPGLVWEFTIAEGDIWAPIAHWTMNEATGTVANDMSGNGYTGTLLNGASWGSDATRDTYVMFDGMDDRISTLFSSALEDDDDFTWAWWANKQSPDDSDMGSIMVGNRYGNTGLQNYEFIKFTAQGAQLANTDSAGSIEKFEYAAISQGDWHHYAMVKSGTNYQWYVDGVLQSTTNFTYSETSPIPFLIGGDDDGSGTKVNEHFQGGIDDVVLYRRALAAHEIENVRDEVYLPVVTMVTLGTPEYWSDETTWSDSLPAHASSHYIVPDTGNLRSEDGTSTFPGTSLTVEGGGKFQFRAKLESGETTTVENLIATGGTLSEPVLLAAGTGNNTANHLDGTLTIDGVAVLSGYGNATGPRDLHISSTIGGSGTVQSLGTSAYPHTCTIASANNTFAGVWEVGVGTLVFENAGAIGQADITVLEEGKLTIADDWLMEAVLTVADSALAEVDLGSNLWMVSTLLFGGTSIADGVYTASELNALGTYSVFVGAGKIRVGPPPTYELIAGWDVWDSTTDPVASVLATGVTATAVTTTEQLSWSRTDERGASNDGTWGSLLGPPVASVAVEDGENLMLPNATTGGTITFTVSNNGSSDMELGSFHFDAYAFRPNAPRTYELSVLAGSSVSTGVIFTSSANAITHVGGSNANDAHDDIDIDMTTLADNTLAAGESVSLVLAFSGGAGDGSGGHHLFVDNVGITGARISNAEPPVLDATFEGGVLTFSWTGDGFKLQSRTNLVEGFWIDVPGGDSSPVDVVPTNGTDFFRLID